MYWRQQDEADDAEWQREMAAEEEAEEEAGAA